MSLVQLRKKINSVDAQLIKLLGKRFLIAQTIGDLKKKHQYTIADKAREKELTRLHESLEKKYSLSPKFTKSLWNLILKESKNLQRLQVEKMPREPLNRSTKEYHSS